MPLAGGHLALDFVNTVGGLHIEPPSPAEELMDTYDDFTIWCARLSVISERQASSLRAAGRRDDDVVALRGDIAGERFHVLRQHLPSLC